MQKVLLSSLIILLAVGCTMNHLSQQQESTMIITSPAFKEGEAIPEKYSCKGENINPELRIMEIPKETKSMVLIVDDPDAPNGTFTHWLVWDISPAITEIPENAVPTGAVQGANGAGKAEYTGPCPPSGTHHYYFTIYALDVALNLEDGSSKDQLEQAMGGHVLAQGQLMGTFDAQQ